MNRIAIAYQSKYGQTEKIVNRIAEVFRAEGVGVDLINANAKPGALGSGYSRVIVGGAVYAGKLPKRLVSWATENADRVNQIGCDVFTVSLNAADARPEAREVDFQLVKGFLTQTGLKPRLTKSLKGGLPYSKYGLFLRWMMLKISAAAKGPTDTSRDYEMTDWSEVEEFARACAGSISTVAKGSLVGARS